MLPSSFATGTHANILNYCLLVTTSSAVSIWDARIRDSRFTYNIHYFTHLLVGSPVARSASAKQTRAQSILPYTLPGSTRNPATMWERIGRGKRKTRHNYCSRVKHLSPLSRSPPSWEFAADFVAVRENQVYMYRFPVVLSRESRGVHVDNNMFLINTPGSSNSERTFQLWKRTFHVGNILRL